MADTALTLEFNNLGVICLEEGNRREAMELFKGASQLMTHLVARGEETNAADAMNKALCDPRVRRAHALYMEHIEDGYDAQVECGYEVCVTNTNSSIDGHQHSESSVGVVPVDAHDDLGASTKSFICKRAIHLTKEVLPSQWTQGVTVCCSVILYNMALVYHLAAADSVLESSGQKALSLYEMAFTLLSEQTFEFDSGLLARLLMYCLNNMASLYHELTRWDLSAECMKRLALLASNLMQARGVGLSLHQECQSFLLNAMVLKAPTRAPAA
jgi:hypothetical protein